MSHRAGLTVLGLVALIAATAAPRDVRAADDDLFGHAARAGEATLAMDYAAARAELAKADPALPAIALAKARLALYEEDCDLAASLLSRPAVVVGDEAKVVADVARGCARVTAATTVVDEPAEGVRVRFQEEEDRALVPLIVETVVKARAALERDLGATWAGPTHVTVVRDLLSLSAMTGLPYKSAQTTGTVAVAKWGRVTMLSPRASAHGYPWRDTLTHELTHLAIARETRDRAPLWLHEGLARREETRWREPGPFDERPPAEAIVARGIEMGLDIPLDKLGPSIAMLPSADAATVAFAEVTSFVRFFVETAGDAALPRLLQSLRKAGSVDEALREVSGETLAAWDAKWRAALAKKPKEPLSPLFGLGSTPKGFGDSRERARLAELLLGRDKPQAALVELDKIPAEMLADPSLRYLRARVLEASDQDEAARELVADPATWAASLGSCWGMRGRMAASAGDALTAADSFREARSHDPLGVEAACGVAPEGGASVGTGGQNGQVATPPPGLPQADVPLCAAALARGEPDLGRD